MIIIQAWIVLLKPYCGKAIYNKPIRSPNHLADDTFTAVKFFFGPKSKSRVLSL